jgi:hypothetical protein
VALLVTRLRASKGPPSPPRSERPGEAVALLVTRLRASKGPPIVMGSGRPTPQDEMR